MLVCERPPGKPYAGFWEFPGGKVELNESPLDALKRELHEELGIEVLEADFLFQHQHDYPDKKVLLDLWRITQFSGEPTSCEQQTLLWATHTEIRHLPLLEGNWAILDAL
jgi:8-oxo-dGTP diphosphatase